MWSVTMNPSGAAPAAPAEVEPSACERLCSSEQKSLVACVDSIRAAREDGAGGGGGGASAAAAPACLPAAVAAWTRCCEEANRG
ncbi:hypothetical protein ACHAWF_007587 [Thalassiosira exigua]